LPFILSQVALDFWESKEKGKKNPVLPMQSISEKAAFPNF
jgi:hypothetical protein